ncbi:hypothetical protein IQ256_00770 [cf. Phormidesmis sp. LEGE 11477]|nr:hypothetical protein [cf. Phormidesmis sp. LEGE 11477]
MSRAARDRPRAKGNSLDIWINRIQSLLLPKAYDQVLRFKRSQTYYVNPSSVSIGNIAVSKPFPIVNAYGSIND